MLTVRSADAELTPNDKAADLIAVSHPYLPGFIIKTLNNDYTHRT